MPKGGVKSLCRAGDTIDMKINHAAGFYPSYPKCVWTLTPGTLYPV